MPSSTTATSCVKRFAIPAKALALGKDPIQWTYLVTLCVVLALASCSDSGDPGPLPVCSGGVTLAVSSGTTPTFDWNPECLVGFMIVEEPDGSDRWAIFGVNMTNSIAPGVIYGLVPEGAVLNLNNPPVPLLTGTTYRVAIFVLEPEGQDENAEIVGTATFEP